ncbi:MAG: IPT/TIG domain-containing protein, partial [Actinomycetes bacterium]
MRNIRSSLLVVITSAIGIMLLSPATPAEAAAAAPSVTSIAPTRGPATGLSIITITGTEFLATPTVAIGGVAATNVTRVNATTLTAITGAMAAGVKDVVVTNPDAQSATGAGLFTVYGTAPAGTWTGVNRFAAGGATAVAISQPNNAATPIITVIATVANTPGLIHRSLDRGATWTTFTGPVAADGQGDNQVSGWWQQLVASADGQKLFLRETVTHNCCTIGSIWVSSDGGATWSRANAGFANNRLKYNSIAMSSDGTKLWATADAGRDGGAGAWKSTDGGATWSKYAGAGAIANTAGPVSMSRDGLRVLIKSWGGPDFYSVNGGLTFADTGAPPWNVALDDWDGVACADDYCRIFEMAVGQLARAPGGLLLASPEFGGNANVRFSTNSALTWNTTPLNNGCGGGQQVGTASLSLDGTLGAITHPGCGLILGVFTSGPPPTVKRIGSITGEFGTPIAGSGGGWNGGGRVMELSGTNFQQGATVSFGRSHQNPNQAIAFGTNVVVTNSTTIRVTTPAVDYTGFVSVFVTNPDGQTISYGYGRGNNIPGPLCNPQAGVTYCFQYQDAGMPAGALVVTPNSGVPGGGTTVRLSVTAGSVADPGTAFDWNQGIVFGGVDLVGQQVCGGVCGWSVVTPAHAEGPVDVSVKFGVQGEIIRKTTLNAFTYASLGAITAVVPGNGSTVGGATVRITGAGFVAGASVRFGTVLSPSVTVVNSTAIDATVPANTVGTFSVSVTNGAGTWGVGSNLFTYVAAPTVTSVTASSGPAIGGTAVTITGTGFSAGASVRFGGAAAAQGTVTVVNATTITVTTPLRAAGLVDVVVTNTDASGSGTGAGLYTYTAGPTVISIDVIGGAVTGSNTVIITGTNFSTNPTVQIGGNAATNVLRLSATRISATVPAGLVGLRTVQVTNTDTQVGAIANLYRYYDLTTSVASTTPTVTVPILVPVETLHSNTSATTVEATTTNMRRTGVEARDTAVRVTVPAGAIPTASRIIVEPVASLANLALTAPTRTTSMLAAVSAQALDADGNAITTNFTTPVTIAVTVPADSVPSGAAITSFSMQFWSGTQWSDIASTGVLNNDGSVT